MFSYLKQKQKKFGCFFNSVIKSIESFVGDRKAFTFSINSNGIIKYDIIDSRNAIEIHLLNKEELITIGYDDIVIMKKDSNEKCHWNKNEKTYNYQGKEYTLTDGEKEFEIKHIQVIQMEKT